MKRNECEKNLDSICDRIGESVYQIQDFMMEQNVVHSHLADLEQLDQMKEEDREQAAALAGELLNYDEGYRYHHKELSHLQYGLLCQYEREVSEEIKDIRELEENQSLIKGDMLQMEQEQIESQDQEEELEERQKVLLASMVSVLAMAAIGFLLLLYLYKNYQFAYKMPAVALLSITCIILIILMFCRGKGKKKKEGIQRKNQRYTELIEQEKLRYEINRQRLVSFYSKYQVESQRELSNFWARYLDGKKKYEENNIEMIRKLKQQLLHTIKDYDLIFPEFWINFPYGFISEKQQQRIREYLEERKQKIEEMIAGQYQEQEKGFDEMKVILEEYPDLTEYVIHVLEGYDIQIP